ncbi:MAG: sulfite exporter TauE/SafE family protein [Nanoarchaeota archaeon]
MNKVELKIKGMECASCEVLLERKFKELDGITEAKVNHATGKATLTGFNIPPLQQLQDTLKDTKYRIVKEDNLKGNSEHFTIKKDHIEIGAIFLIVVALYLILKQFAILPNIGISENMSYGLILLIGLVAAFSTCMAVSGGLLLAVSTKYNENHPALTGVQKFKPHIYFNIGRILSYTILGGILGALGSLIILSARISGIITIVASIAMLILGLQLLKIFPWLNRFTFKMPKFIAHRVHDVSTTNSKVTPFGLGAATFFLPCGFTMALQLYVLSTGSFIVGALSMLAFSLGTLPGLISVGAVSSFSTGTFKRYFVKFTAVLVILLSIFNANNALALVGSPLNFDSLLPSASASTNGNADIKIIDGKQIVDLKVDGLDYYPSQFTILEDVPVEWRIDGKNAVGCARVISVPGLGITEFLPQNQIKTITFTAKDQGTIRFSCTMGMAGPGTFNVVPNTEGIKGAEILNNNNQPEKIPNGPTQKLSMEISRERGFYPNSFTVRKNIPVELNIDTKLPLRGCMSTLIIPDYNVAHLLSLGKTTLKFTPTTEGTVPFTCSMGARMGEFIITD